MSDQLPGLEAEDEVLAGQLTPARGRRNAGRLIEGLLDLDYAEIVKGLRLGLGKTAGSDQHMWNGLPVHVAILV